MPWDVYAKFGFPGADDLASMFRYYDVFEKDFNALRALEVTRKFHPHIKSLEQFAEDHKAELQKL